VAACVVNPAVCVVLVVVVRAVVVSMATSCLGAVRESDEGGDRRRGYRDHRGYIS
jgi:hypothetical protein